STGHESDGEYLDVDFREPEAEALDLDALPEVLTAVLPEGLAVQTVAPIATSEPSLQQAVTSCEWDLDALGLDTDAAPAALDRPLSASELVVTRQRKGNDVVDDVRPYMLDLTITGPVPAVLSPSGSRTITPAGSRLHAELATQPRGLRPAELLALLGPELLEG